MTGDIMDNNKIPPNVIQFIQNCFDPNLPLHVRENYRDIISHIHEVCGETLKDFNKKISLNKAFKTRK